MSSIARQVRERIRPRAEQIIGVATQLGDDLSVLSPIAAALPDDATVIDDGQEGPLPFRNSDFHVYVGLATLLVGNYSSIKSVAESIKVRPLASILRAYAPPDSPITDAVSALQHRIRPMAAHLQRLRYQFDQDAKILLDADSIGGLSDETIITEQRGDAVPEISAAAAKALVFWGAATIDPSVNTPSVSRAVNAASLHALVL